MKRQLLILSIILLTALGCDKLDIAAGTPDCIKKKITEFNKNASCNNANVKRYTFQQKTVYVFDPGNCGADMTSDVIDKDCNSLGFLGGLVGATEVNGEPFSNAHYEETVWEK